MQYSVLVRSSVQFGGDTSLQGLEEEESRVMQSCGKFRVLCKPRVAGRSGLAVKKYTCNDALVTDGQSVHHVRITP